MGGPEQQAVPDDEINSISMPEVDKKEIERQLALLSPEQREVYEQEKAQETQEQEKTLEQLNSDFEKKLKAEISSLEKSALGGEISFHEKNGTTTTMSVMFGNISLSNYGLKNSETNYELNGQENSFDLNLKDKTINDVKFSNEGIKKFLEKVQENLGEYKAYVKKNKKQKEQEDMANDEAEAEQLLASLDF